jgi:hypothetical protein
MTGNSPLKSVFELKDTYMMIENNSAISISVNTKVLDMAVELKLTTNIIPDPSDPTGNAFLEQFQGVELGGRKFPVPKDWQRSRPLEFFYFDVIITSDIGTNLTSTALCQSRVATS